jgi:hypothetical protein
MMPIGPVGPVTPAASHWKYRLGALQALPPCTFTVWCFGDMQISHIPPEHVCA